MEERALPKLRVSKDETNKRIQVQIEQGKQFLNRRIESETEMDKAELEICNWSNYNKELLNSVFNSLPEHYYEEIHFQLLDDEDYDAFSDELIPVTWEYKKHVYQKSLSQIINGLEGICQRLELYDVHKDEPQSTFGRDVFIVHGHDEAAKFATVDFVKKFDLNPIILDEKANKGQTIIEKFEAHAGEAGYAIALLTPDDIGARKGDKEQRNSRARQNVILELGYFMGKLGRERVCVLHKEDVELPSDIHGILYVPMDNNGNWKFNLAKEMQHAGLPVDLNKLA